MGITGRASKTNACRRSGRSATQRRCIDDV
jgi:hypothetical protein